MKCIDLKKRFGDRYRVRTEEGQRTFDPWLFVIQCKWGEITPYGGDLLLACTSRRGNLPRMLVAAGCTITQDGDDGVNAKVHVRDFAKVARVMKPRRRRVLKEAQRQAARERLAGFAFQPARQQGISAPGSLPTELDESKHPQQRGNRNLRPKVASTSGMPSALKGTATPRPASDNPREAPASGAA